MTTQAKYWEYEREIRILSWAPGIEYLDRRFLKQVCFGLETSESDMALVKRIIEQGQYNLQLCRMVRDGETDFGLMATEIF